MPWVYVGAQDLTWELRTHANTGLSWYPLDAQDGSVLDSGPAFGTPCVPAGQDMRMEARGVVRAVGWNNTLQLHWVLLYTPQNQPAAVFVGAGIADVALPGLCTNFYVASPFVTFAGVTSGFSFVTPLLTVPSQPSYVGAQLHAQGAVVDPGRSGVPVALTWRYTATIPAPPAVGGPGRQVFSGSLTSVNGVTTGHPAWVITRFKH